MPLIGGYLLQIPTKASFRSVVHRPAGRSNVSELPEKLDVGERLGITKAEWRRIIVMRECRLITMRKAFDDRDCQHEVIDLTGDD